MTTNQYSSPEAQGRWVSFWGAELPATPEQKAGARPQIYVNTPPKSLADYAQAVPKSRFEQANELDFAYIKRLEGTGLQHLAEVLPTAELQRVVDCYNQARQRLEGHTETADELRQRLAARTTGVDVGLMGSGDTPYQRAAMLGSRGHSGQQTVEANGHLVGSAAQPLNLTRSGATHVAIDILSRLPRKDVPAFAQRPVVAGGSSGDGWVEVDRG